MIGLILTAALVAPDVQAAESVDSAVVITLEDALRIALSENTSIKVADREVERVGYARRGAYASLFPQIDGNAAYQRTIKKQVMYMDGDGGFDIGAMVGEALVPMISPLYAAHGFPLPEMPSGEGAGGSGTNDGFSVGRWNTWSAGVNASMPLINAQLWKSLKISDQDVEIAIEKSRSSRLETVTSVKQAFFTCLLAKEAFNVYRTAYENALYNLEQTQKRYNAQKASEMDLARAKTSYAQSIPNVFDAENSCVISLWQLKAVMGINLDQNIEVAGSLEDWQSQIGGLLPQTDDLSGNSALRQLAMQAEELANAIKVQQYSTLPSLAVAFSYSLNAMTNDFNFSEYKWSPYSYVGLSLNIPIFAGGKRHSNIRQAKVQATQLELSRIETERQLNISIRQMLNTMNTSERSLGSALSAVESAEKAYSIAQKAYAVGRSTMTDLNDAQFALIQARLSVAQSIFNYQTAKASLEGIIGADFTENK